MDLQSDLYGQEEYQKFLPQLNVSHLPGFPSPSSGGDGVKTRDLSYMALNNSEPPFSSKKRASPGNDMFDNMMSPPITPGDKLGNFTSTSPQMTTFQNDLNSQGNLQFNLSPPLTINGSPELQYGDLYQNQVDYTDGQPVYNFIGMDNNMQDQYEESNYQLSSQLSPEHAGSGTSYSSPYSRLLRQQPQLKHSVSEASLHSWGGASPPSYLQPLQSDWNQPSGGAAEPVGQFHCSFPGCNKVFTKQTNLKSHVRIHNTERSYGCEDCGASFRRSHDLKRHQRSLHSDVKPFGCGRCGKRFSRMVFFVSLYCV